MAKYGHVVTFMGYRCISNGHSTFLFRLPEVFLNLVHLISTIFALFKVWTFCQFNM